jgi:replicative DNA helicase Mcm
MSGENLTHSRIVDLWDEFLRGYKIEDNFYYFKRLQHLQHLGLKTLYFDYNHLVDAIIHFVHAENDEEDDFNALRRMVIFDPDEARETLKEAAFNILKEVNLEYAESIAKTFRAEFLHAPIEKEMTALNVDDSSKFMKTTGFVTEYDETSSTLIHHIAWRCADDHYTKTETPDKPKQCRVNECGNQILVMDEKHSSAEDYIRFKVQQRSDRTAEGKSPVIMEFETIGPDNVKFIKEQLKFGQYVGVSGIVRTKFSRRSSGQGKSLGEMYIEACSVENLPDSYLTADDPDYGDRVKYTIRHENEEQDLEKMINSMYPSVHLPKNDIMKEMSLMQLVGSDPLVQPDGSRIRGEIQMLVLGDPGVAKSRIAEYYKHARKRVMYNSAGKSSSVGLVGGMKMDRDGRWQIASGVFGLAGDGIVILDEFANRPDSEYMDLLEPLGDTQSITIAKGTHYRQETVNTAVLAIANAATFSRYYDLSKNIYENTKIPPTILQRMDAILIRKDTPDPKEDEAKARHFFEMQAKSVTEKEFRQGEMANVKRKDENFYPVGYVAKWLAWVRETFHPRFTDNPKAVEIIVDWYKKWRKFSITIAKDAKEGEVGGMTIPGADMRKLASVMRFSNAHARACQRDYVEERDVLRAIDYVELTSAEAGVWKQGDDGRKEYMKDELAAHHSLMVERAAAKERAKFEDEIDKLSWIKCKTCHGSGEDTPLGEEEIQQCGDCEGNGWIEQIFSKNDAIRELMDIRRAENNDKPWLTNKAFEIIWTEKEKKMEIIPTEYGRFRNTTRHQMREIRTNSNKMMSAEEMRKQKLRDELAQRNPSRFVRLNKE